MQPKLTVAGYRGIWGTTLTENIAREYVRAFGALLKKRGGKKVLVGRDGRKSGPMLMEAVIRELLALGFDVVDLGMMPTPTVLFLIREESAAGAVIVTASHNPIEYNGLKFATETGAFTTEEDVAEIESLRGKSGEHAAAGTRSDGSSLFERHLDVIEKHVDFEKIKSAKFKVAIDPINSVGCATTPKFLERLGATVVGINMEATGEFAHEPEPIAKNLTDLERLVRESGAHVGFAQDPDGDRLVVCDETGALLSEEFTLPLCLKAVLRRRRATSWSIFRLLMLSEDVARAFGGRTFRSKVGEANVVAGIREHNAVIGGEGGSGAIWPATSGTRDSFTCMALILELMATEGKPLSEIAASLPKYFLIKSKFPVASDLARLYGKMTRRVPRSQSRHARRPPSRLRRPRLDPRPPFQYRAHRAHLRRGLYGGTGLRPGRSRPEALSGLVRGFPLLE